MIKKVAKKIADRLGYQVRSTKYIPVQFVQQRNILGITLDHVISSHIMKMKHPEQFFFIQVGAFDGKECDPLYEYIVRNFWKGIMLEPQPGAFKKLSTLHGNRTDIQLVNAAIDKEEKKAAFYTLEGEGLPAWAQGMASFDKENIIKHKEQVPDIEKYIVKTEINCTSFGHLFSKFNIGHVDLLQVDTEGFDAEILYMFPFEKIKPAIIHFESKHLTKPVLEDLLEYLINRNYLIAYDGQEDMLAVYIGN